MVIQFSWINHLWVILSVTWKGGFLSAINSATLNESAPRSTARRLFVCWGEVEPNRRTTRRMIQRNTVKDRFSSMLKENRKSGRIDHRKIWAVIWARIVETYTHTFSGLGRSIDQSQPLNTCGFPWMKRWHCMLNTGNIFWNTEFNFPSYRIRLQSDKKGKRPFLLAIRDAVRFDGKLKQFRPANYNFRNRYSDR